MKTWRAATHSARPLNRVTHHVGSLWPCVNSIGVPAGWEVRVWRWWRFIAFQSLHELRLPRFEDFGASVSGEEHFEVVVVDGSRLSTLFCPIERSITAIYARLYGRHTWCLTLVAF